MGIMQALLYIGHGTRLQAGVEQCLTFIEQVQRQIHVPIQETAFLELVNPTIEEGVRRCVEQGTTKIAIVPLLLLTAHHARQDIPQEIQAVQQKFPNVEFSYGTPFGVDSLLVEEVIRHIEEAKSKWTNQLQDKQFDVLLIVRGSSDPSILQQVEQLRRLVNEKGQYEHVHVSYLYGVGPRFEEALATYENSDKLVIVLPYLLFDGLLSVAIEKKVAAAKKTNPNILLANKLGAGLNVQQVLQQRIFECLKGGIVDGDRKEIRKIG